MRLSKLFSKTSKAIPADETSKNAQLLIQAGYIYKEMAGVYAYLPLGLRVLENIKQVVREEMDKANGQEIIMTNLQSRDKWEVTGRWDDKTVDIWFKTSLKDESEVGLAWSHEEPIIEMFKRHISSYKDFPVSVYQFQTKLRNELRAKSGILRGREFVMKDMYSVSADAKQHEAYYNSIIDVYNKVYERLGIGKDTYVTFASGGAFTEFSHEFQTICEAGEDKIYLHKGKNVAINEEVLNDANLHKLGLKREELEEVRSSEVGNIFNFGIDKSKTMNFTFTDEKGEKQYPFLGSYGIGITRVMGVIAEKFSDDKGLVWPKNIAPAFVYLARLGESSEVTKEADALFETLTQKGIETLYDDRDVRAGEKFADADLLGIPFRVVVSEKTVKTKQFEIKARSGGEAKLLDISGILEFLGT